MLRTSFFFIFKCHLSSVTSMASTCGLHLQLSSLLSTCKHHNLYVPWPFKRVLSWQEGKEAKTFPWQESLLGGCQVRQKVDIALRSDHHIPKIMAAPSHVAQGKRSSFILGAAGWTAQGEEAKNHLGTQAAQVGNINKFGDVSCSADHWNKMGPGANYMEIFLFAHFTARQSREYS